jgi:hypothetical protein
VIIVREKATSVTEKMRDAVRRFNIVTRPSSGEKPENNGVEVGVDLDLPPLTAPAPEVAPMLTPSSTSEPIQEIPEHPPGYRLGTDNVGTHHTKDFDAITSDPKIGTPQTTMTTWRQWRKAEKERKAEEEREAEEKHRKRAERRAQAASLAPVDSSGPGKSVESDVVPANRTRNKKVVPPPPRPLTFQGTNSEKRDLLLQVQDEPKPLYVSLQPMPLTFKSIDNEKMDKLLPVPDGSPPISAPNVLTLQYCYNYDSERQRERLPERLLTAMTGSKPDSNTLAGTQQADYNAGESVDYLLAGELPKLDIVVTFFEWGSKLSVQTAAGMTTHHNTSLAPISTPNLDYGQSLASRLNSYFTGRDIPQSPYSDDEIHEISALLKYHTPRWCKTPRTYVILRTIRSFDLLDQCIDVGFSDYWLPVTDRNLPEFLRPSIRTAFVNAQTLVLTKSMDLEKGAEGQHCYFRKSETLPLERKGILGSDGYGQVDRVLSLISFKEYARKRVLRSAAFRGRRKEDVKHFIAEIEILKRLKHRHVVEFVDSYTDAKYIGLIMTPIADGDFATYMANAKPVQYPELRTFFGCLATGLKFLHQHNVRHKAIKPGNILVNSGKVLFTDFGLSLDFTDATGSTTMSMVNGMTPRYCAPEVANYEPRNTISDI